MSLRTGKAFNARFPEPLHRLIKEAAVQAAKKNGGQANMNKVIVEAIYGAMKTRLSEDQQKEVERFISKL
jgi:hypothetical protein